MFLFGSVFAFSKKFQGKELKIPTKDNIYTDFTPSKDEIFEDLFKNPNFKIERIISKGQRSPDGFWYEQEQDEWVLLLEGKAVLLFEGNVSVEMSKGDYMLIPRSCKHRVEWTDPNQETFWLAVHFK